LIAGSSVGATNALALGLGIVPGDMVGVYRDHAGTIFKRSLGRGFFRAAYRTDNQRRGHLEGLASAGVENGETKLLRDLGKRVLVTSFQLNGAVGRRVVGRPAWHGKVFHNFELDSDGSPNPDLDEKVIDVLLRSSAAPVAFPVYQGYADGGLMAINPSVCALAQAVNRHTGNAKLED